MVGFVESSAFSVDYVDYAEPFAPQIKIFEHGMQNQTSEHKALLAHLKIQGSAEVAALPTSAGYFIFSNVTTSFRSLYHIGTGYTTHWLLKMAFHPILQRVRLLDPLQKVDFKDTFGLN
jgi:hypothetical protein